MPEIVIIFGNIPRTRLIILFIYFQKCFDLIQVGFVVILITYLFECVDYKVLFNIVAPPGKKHGEKVLLNDVTIPWGECAAAFSYKVCNIYIYRSIIFDIFGLLNSPFGVFTSNVFLN